MTQDIFHWEDVRRRLEIGVRKSIRHFSIVATSVVIIPWAICWGGIMFLTQSSVSPSVLFFERKLPLNHCTEFFEIIQFHYFSRNFGSFNLEKNWHLVEVKMGWFFGGELCPFVELFCVFNAYPAIHYVFSCQVMREHGVCGLALYFFHCIWHCKSFGILIFFVIWITVLGNCYILFVGHLL